jgi:ABC-type antimicrobial peptide transport system permease subunit
MFDLEKAIKAWRKALHKNESLEDGNIEELESHLRDDMENRIKQGVNEEQAFLKAAENIGLSQDIGAELYKTKTRRLSGRPPWRINKYGPALIWSYIRVAFRRIKRQKGFSFINIIGLAVGMAACTLILLWVQDELSYDSFHKSSDQIYLIIAEDHSGGKVFAQAGSPAMLGETMMNELPEVLNFTRVQAGWPRWNLHLGEKNFLEEYLAAVDPSFFEIFSFPFIKGDPKTALKDRYSIVITETLAKKIYGDEDPMGKLLELNNADMTVSGVIKDIPRNSHLHFTFAFPAINMTQWRESKLDRWDYDQFANYVVLRKGSNIKDVNAKMMAMVKKNLPNAKGKVYLLPLKKVHLHLTDVNTWMLAYPTKGNITYIYIFAITAFCVLLLACINFMNLSTARYSTRAKEVGMRKVVGARRKDLIKQFLGESALLTFLALLIAVFLVELFLPVFNDLSGKDLSMLASGNWQFLAGLLIIALATSLISGSYPSVFLSAFRPVKIIKEGGLPGKIRGGTMRRIFVVLQFTFTIALIICSAAIFLQLRFMQNRDLGYDTENIITFAAYNQYETNYDAAKAELLQNPDIIAVCRGMPPSGGFWGTTEVDWEGKDPSKEVKIAAEIGDFDYLKVFNMKMAEGRFFSSELAGDGDNWVLNETAIAAMELEDPIGKWFSFQDRKGMIIGIVKDYHGTSLHNPIAPLAMQMGDGFFICAKFRSGNVPHLLEFLQTKWEKFVGAIPFRYGFMDERVKDWYQAEQRVGTLFRYFTSLAVFIACLGLFGLASFMTERRTKEIGIRRVLGAKVPLIVLLLTKEFAKWIIIANLIAWPMAFFAVKQWLRGFAYRIDLGWEIFIFSSLLALVIAVATVSYQAIKAAVSNPVNALRYE